MPKSAVAPNQLASKSLTQAVREQLLRLIASGSLAPGDRLNEVHLAETFGISRGPLREAARELEGQGFLFTRPRQGFYVSRFTRREIVDIYRTKAWLEDAFIADLSEHMGIAARKAVLADIDSVDPSDRITFSETLFQFRLRMSTHVRNRFLAELMIALYRKFYVIAAVVANVHDEPERTMRIIATLRRFWGAMADDDIAAAKAVMAEDTAHWLADLPSRFAGEGEAGA
jgi:DNA-binding GntR family transcriptional regulator